MDYNKPNIGGQKNKQKLVRRMQTTKCKQVDKEKKKKLKQTRRKNEIK